MKQGCKGELVAYATSQAHSSIEKAVRIAGIGDENLRLIDVDAQLAMRPDALARQIEEDRRAGKVPCIVCATVGTTSSNALDPLPEIGRISQEQGIWFHVDSAMSGTAALCPEFRHTSLDRTGLTSSRFTSYRPLHSRCRESWRTSTPTRGGTRRSG